MQRCSERYGIKAPPKEVHTPPCCCKNICWNQFRLPSLQVSSRLAYAKKLTDLEAKILIEKSLGNILKQFLHLQNVFDVHKSVITTRWRKKSREKKAEYLHKAGPRLKLEPDQWKEAEDTSGIGAFAWEIARANPAAVGLSLLKTQFSHSVEWRIEQLSQDE